MYQADAICSCGVASTPGAPSDFRDDEFCIFSGNRQRMRYLVEYADDGALRRIGVCLISVA